MAGDSGRLSPPLMAGIGLGLLLAFLLGNWTATLGGQRGRIATHKVRTTALDINSFPDTTGPGVPHRLRAVLTAKYGGVNETADTYFGAGTAVDRLEAECQWDPATATFRNAKCMEQFGYRSDPLGEDEPACSEIDIVVPSIRDLDFLEAWKSFFLGYHIIIVQDGDPSRVLKVPDWVDYELYNWNDIQKALGERHWIISRRDASIRNFGFLVSRKRFVFTIDDDCLPAARPDGTLVDVIAGHLRNLRSPSTPYYFNTLYDPYRPGADFVRGYPYSLRQGVPTALSHGIWVNVPDYDAPTQLLKPAERNERLLDFTQTIPAGVLYPMCSMNVAFQRELIGPAFMQGLMGDGQPWGRYDDMFAGWASKVVADHLHLGVKSGAPYVRHNKASNPFTNLRKEYKGLFWQEHVIDFFDNLTLSGCDSSQACYRQLAARVRRGLTRLHPYFGRLATAMELWVQAWDEAQKGALPLAPSRRSRRRDLAALTVWRETRAPIAAWVEYYQLLFHPHDIWILNATKSNLPALRATPNVLPAACVNGTCEQSVRHIIHRLLSMGFQAVLMTEATELLFAPVSLRPHLCAIAQQPNATPAEPGAGGVPWGHAVQVQQRKWRRGTKQVLFRRPAEGAGAQGSSSLVLVDVRLANLTRAQQWPGRQPTSLNAFRDWLQTLLASLREVPSWLSSLRDFRTNRQSCAPTPLTTITI